MVCKSTLLESIHDHLTGCLGQIPKIEWLRSLPGGDINHAASIRSGHTSYFLKYHENAPAGMYEAEANALIEISDQACIRVPKPVMYGVADDTAWLVMEYLELSGNGQESLLGEQLAAMHIVCHKHYGWTRDNYIGTNLQTNTRGENWSRFWRDCRLGPQFAMAECRGFDRHLSDIGEQLLNSMDQLMDGHQPPASLLHGDLWAGNKAFTVDGQVVIFDPASYHGDRETDIAMTELFGGFGPAFYSAYQAHYPLPDAYQLRKDLYNLYHMLNHLNMFGEAYLFRCESMIRGLLAQIR